MPEDRRTDRNMLNTIHCRLWRWIQISIDLLYVQRDEVGQNIKKKYRVLRTEVGVVP